MPFGKWQGHALEDVPDGYLIWLRETVDLREPLRSAVYREWSRRFDYDDDGDVTVIADDLDDRERTLLREVITAGFRALVFRYHPDAGGSVEDMKRLNALMEKLRRAL
jgi:hypothetical protein